jgi:hypothetical protein
MKTFLWILALVLTVAGVIISFKFFQTLSFEYTYGKSPVLVAESGQVGDFIGGVVGTIFSLAGFILLLITLNVQTRSSYIEQFESKVFELIKLHRDNVGEINITRRLRDKNEIVEIEFSNRRAFKLIISDFISCRNELRQFMHKFAVDDIYESKYLEETINILNIEKDHIRILSTARTNIAYCIIFYGVGREGFTILQKLFRDKYKKPFTDGLLNYIRMKPIESSEHWLGWKKLKTIKKVSDRLNMINQIITLRSKSPESQATNEYFYDSAYIKYYGGQQHRLGHYFRHLFQSITYINSQKKLTRKEKYAYIKMFRAQLSTYEQELLFINSLSILGMAWELKPKFKKNYFELINDIRFKNRKLITNYNLIKNVPGDHIFGINYSDYYPEVKYETLI